MAATAVVSTLMLCAMPQMSEAKSDDDKWTGTTNKAERRRRQNCLNQRATRRRKAALAAAAKEELMKEQISRLKFATPCTSLHHDNDTRLSPGVVWRPPVPRTIRPAIPDPHDLLSVFTLNQLVKIASQTSLPDDRVVTRHENVLTKWLTRFNERLSKQLSPMSSDRLLSLIHYNLFRGFAVHCVVLGIASQGLCENVTTFKLAKGQNVPPSLMPTKLQETVLHPTWLDLFPSPRMRDNMIRRVGTFDEDELCSDIVGGMWEDEPTGRTRDRFISLEDEQGDNASARDRQGLILWGEPWDMNSWEITPEFLRNWGWVVEGCPEAITASNRWRAARGEVPLADALRMNLKNL